MGLVGLLIFGLKCFDGLAWPLFALGYPLCASIQAIETDSKCYTKKLVTYWVLFSFISLFEHTFLKLLECLPFWSYIKLVIICGLVMPRFNATVYVYEHLVRPCLSTDPQTVINWFNQQKDLLLQREDILAEAKRYIEDNGPKALEKLIASQSKSTKSYLVVEDSRAAAEEGEVSKCEEPSGMQKEIKTVEVTEKKEVTEAKQSKCREPGVMQKNMEVTEKKDVTEAKQSKCQEPSIMQKDIEVTVKKEVTEAKKVVAYIENRTFAPVEAGREHPQIPAFKKVQKEWTCATPHVTTQSETALNAHLQERRHQDAFEQLKTKNQESRSKVSYASASKKSDLSKQEQEKCVSVNVCSSKITSHEAKKSDPPKEEPEKCAPRNRFKRKIIARYEVKKSDVLKEEQEKCVSNDGWDFSTGHEAKKSDPPKEKPEKCASSNGLKHRIITRYEVKNSNVVKEIQEKCVSNDGLVFDIVTMQEEKVQGRQDKCVSNNGWNFTANHEEKKSDPPKEELEKCGSNNGLKHKICCPTKVWQPKRPGGQVTNFSHPHHRSNKSLHSTDN